jgi:protocatechuate 3,4-dioxygenase beta subunit
VLAHGLALTGIVKDQGDRPIAGAELVLQQAFEARGGRGVGRGFGSDVRMPIFASKTTAADGRFEFKGLIPAEYGLSVTHAGHGHEQIGPLTLAADKPHEPIEVRLQAGATITGFVHDKSGKGVEGVVVTARRGASRFQGPSGGFGRQPSSEPTEADGAFTIDGLVAGEAYDLAPMAMAVGVIPGGRALRQTGIAAPAEGIEFVLPGTGTIKGVVTDADGERTIADFEVSYSGAGMFGGFAGRGRRRNAGPNQPQSVHADDGQFVLTDVAAGTWDVEVTAEGYQPARASGVIVEEGGATEGITIALQRGALVSGRVLDAASGKPVVDAQVRARLQGESRGGARFPDTSDGRNATSDADGHFELKGLAPGSYSVSATHPDYSDAAQTIAVKEQPATSVDLRLGKGGALAGVVVAGGRPVAGASVGLAAPGEGLGRGGMGGGHNFTTDDAGRFRFDHLTPGRYSLMANLRSEASPPSEVVLLAGQSNESIVLTLGGGAAIHGHVVGLPETELAGVNVNASGPEDYRAFVRTATGGSFELSGAPAGPIELRAMAGDIGGGMRSAAAQVLVADGQAETSVDIRFESGFRIDGHVTRGGQPVADAFVTAFGTSGGGRSATDRTDANGAYALEGLPEGNYQVSTNGSSGTGRGGSTVSRAVTVTSDVTVDLEVPLARLAGIVVEASTQRPLADANVQVTGAGRGGATTDSQGRFTLEGLEPRAYRVNVQKPAYQTETQELTATEDGDVRIELVRGEGIGLLARDGVFGTPLRSVQVRVLDPQGQSVYGGSVPLDSEGRGEIPSLQPGSYQLRADASGYAPVSLSSITVPTSALTLTLTPGGALTIKSGPETLALPQASVRLLGANGQVYLPSIYSNDGSIRLNGPVRLLENVAPGRYTVSLNGGDGPQVDVREGESAAVQLK